MSAKRGNVPPSHNECLNTLRTVYKLLSKQGPGAVNRKTKALSLLADANDYMVETYNIMDPTGSKIQIHNLDKGTCVDPSTETYWSA